jgi:PHD/YefM family antitoxin component YafN of YafNO toxin-antitoxin module
MAVQNTKSITLPKSAIREKEGVVILPLEKWKKVEEELEDLEMYRSESLAREINKRRKEKKAVSLEKLLKKHRV